MLRNGRVNFINTQLLQQSAPQAIGGHLEKKMTPEIKQLLDDAVILENYWHKDWTKAVIKLQKSLINLQNSITGMNGNCGASDLIARFQKIIMKTVDLDCHGRPFLYDVTLLKLCNDDSEECKQARARLYNYLCILFGLSNDDDTKLTKHLKDQIRNGLQGN